jgi:hypothetical protein
MKSARRAAWDMLVPRLDARHTRGIGGRFAARTATPGRQATIVAAARSAVLFANR